MPYPQPDANQPLDSNLVQQLNGQVEQLLKKTTAAQSLKGDNNFLNYCIEKDRQLFNGQYSTIHPCENQQLQQKFGITSLMCRIFKPNAKIDYLNGVYLKILRFVGQHSPNIIKTFDIFYDETHNIYLFQEYANRGNCLEFLRAGNIVDYKQMLKWSYSIWRAMDFLGNCAIVHRSIRPKHILLHLDSADGAGSGVGAKLSGFRDSEIYWDSDQQKVIQFPKRPLEQMKFATFQAPECFGNPQETFDPISADVFSFGATCFYILARYYPFDVVKVSSKLEDIDRNIQARINSCKGLPQGGKDWFAKLLNVDPQKRMKFNDIVQDDWFKSE